MFAPVAALIRAESADQAVAIANEVRYGLVAAVFTSDLGRALRLTRQLEAGMIRVNAPTSGVDFQAPFGGSKESSYGPREQGHGCPRRSTPSPAPCSSFPDPGTMAGVPA